MRSPSAAAGDTAFSVDRDFLWRAGRRNARRMISTEEKMKNR